MRQNGCPLASHPAQRPHWPHPNEREALAPRAMPRPVNALIVDDEAHVRVLLVALLKQLGVKTVWEAVDGTAGIAQAALHNPEVVLLDINLPEISGLDVLTKLKAEHPNIPVIM